MSRRESATGESLEPSILTQNAMPTTVPVRPHDVIAAAVGAPIVGGSFRRGLRLVDNRRRQCGQFGFSLPLVHAGVVQQAVGIL